MALSTALMLQNVKDVNTFDVVTTVTVLGGSDNVNVYIRLWQADREERYIPETSSTLTVTFPRNLTTDATDDPGPSNQDILISATNPFTPDDRSIWLAALDGTATPDEVDTIVSGGIIVTLTEPVNGITTFFVPMVITKKLNPTTGC